MSEPRPDAAAAAAGWDCHVHVFDRSAAVVEGHYQPAHRPLAQIETEAARHGVGHLVLVQPSVYGPDNSLLLRALALQPGRHRGVVVVDERVAADDWQALHALGVRGVRLNRVSPVGERGSVARRFEALAPLLESLGWHLQWYVQPQHLAEVAALHAGSGLPCVLDHLGGAHAGLAGDAPAWDALADLAREGAWVKLSGWYRLGDRSPYPALLPHVKRLAELFGPHTVWGSDWPHTGLAPDEVPEYAATWAPVVDALGLSSAELIREQGAALYA